MAPHEAVVSSNVTATSLQDCRCVGWNWFPVRLFACRQPLSPPEIRLGLRSQGAYSQVGGNSLSTQRLEQRK